MALKLFWIALAGAFGTLARYSLSATVHRWFGSAFPWATATVNILGCFLFGLIWAVAVERSAISPEFRTVLLVGFMGAFTTFSTFISETGHLIDERALLLAFANIALQVMIGLVAFFLGLGLARAV